MQEPVAQSHNVNARRVFNFDKEQQNTPYRMFPSDRYSTTRPNRYRYAGLSPGSS